MCRILTVLNEAIGHHLTNEIVFCIFVCKGGLEIAASNKEMAMEFKYFGDVWNFFKKYYFVSLDAAYWDAVVAEAREIVRRYEEQPLCTALIKAILDELDRKGQALKEAKR